MRVLIVDDEPLARNALVNIVSTRKDVEAVETADDAIAALDRLQGSLRSAPARHRDAETSGIEMLDALMKRNLPMPAVIFVTAYSQHAVAAFEKHAVDYVLKPFSEDRIHEAVNVAARRNEAERAAKLVSAMPDIGKAIRPSKKIAIKAKGKIIFIDPSEVMAAKAEGNYVLLQQQTGSHLVRESISTLAEKLSFYGFIRIHRSALINVAYVDEIQPCLTGEYLLRLTGGEEFTVSRTYKKNLSAIAD